jgi:pimeloyl-ACP methyl ester carboxylesterase
MATVTSKDGTIIGYEKIGSGPAVILVDGAFGSRAFGPNADFAALLAHDFTVYTYDRRGRGESGDTQPYAVEREIEDIAALIDAVGGSVYLYGISSGAGLALAAANQGLGEKLAIYEAPFIVDDSRKLLPSDYIDTMRAMVADDKRGDVVKLFMTKGVGLPSIFVYMMRLMPSWSKMKGVAHTVLYDSLIMEPNQHGQPLDKAQFEGINVPTLVVAGGKSPAWMQNGMRALATILPNAEHFTLEGQMHIVKAAALAPVVSDFFKR